MHVCSFMGETVQSWLRVVRSFGSIAIKSCPQVAFEVAFKLLPLHHERGAAGFLQCPRMQGAETFASIFLNFESQLGVSS